MIPAPGVRAPDPGLRPFIDHYWWRVVGAEDVHPVLPDGCVDMVIQVSGCGTRGWVYGTPTRPGGAPVAAGEYYLGIRFRPGQSRHFLDHPAPLLTDRRVDLDRPPGPSLQQLAETVIHGDSFALLDAALLDWLARHPPAPDSLDRALGWLEVPHARVERLAHHMGISVRHLERRILARVGLAPRRYASIRRAQRTLRALGVRPAPDLAGLALTMGYADQSQMTRELRRWLGDTPARLRGRHVGFVQDPPAA